MKLRTFMLAAAFATVGAGQAMAQITAYQYNNTQILSTLNPTVSGVTGKVDATAASIGNSVSITGDNAGVISNDQRFFGNSVATLNGTLGSVVGDASATAAAFSNSANIDVKTATQVSNYQTASWDPTATVNLTAAGITGDLSSTAAAISNSAVISGEIGKVSSSQFNGAYTAANNTSRVTTVVGDVAMTAAAIGNSLTVKGF
jgi:hypothetical protein